MSVIECAALCSVKFDSPDIRLAIGQPYYFLLTFPPNIKSMVEEQISLKVVVNGMDLTLDGEEEDEGSWKLNFKAVTSDEHYVHICLGEVGVFFFICSQRQTQLTSGTHTRISLQTQCTVVGQIAACCRRE